MLPSKSTSSYSPKYSRYSSRYIYYHIGKLTIKLKRRLRSMKPLAICNAIAIDPGIGHPIPQSKRERSKMSHGPCNTMEGLV